MLINVAVVAAVVLIYYYHYHYFVLYPTLFSLRIFNNNNNIFTYFFIFNRSISLLLLLLLFVLIKNLRSFFFKFKFKKKCDRAFCERTRACVCVKNWKLTNERQTIRKTIDRLIDQSFPFQSFKKKPSLSSSSSLSFRKRRKWLVVIFCKIFFFFRTRHRDYVISLLHIANLYVDDYSNRYRRHTSTSPMTSSSSRLFILNRHQPICQIINNEQKKKN